MKHPEYCYSHDRNNNCIIIAWGESGYYKTDYPEGKYDDNVIDKINAERGITTKERRGMELCSMGSQGNPDYDWDEHYQEWMNTFEEK